MAESIKRLWLDDIRRPPSSGWYWARTIQEAKLVVISHKIEMASLDHDMGLHEFDPDAENADVMRMPARYRCYFCEEVCNKVYDMEKGFYTKPDTCPTCGSGEGALSDQIGDPDGAEFAEWLVKEGMVPVQVVIHSMNPIGAKAIYDILDGHAEELSIEQFDPSCRSN